jgi:hypothetical protein
MSPSIDRFLNMNPVSIVVQAGNETGIRSFGSGLSYQIMVLVYYSLSGLLFDD